MGPALPALTLITGLERVYGLAGPGDRGQRGPETQAAGATCNAILVGGGAVLGVLTAAEVAALTDACRPTVLDATGLIAVPGFIDMHVHLAGGGGEAGPSSRTPEARLSELLLAGCTTVVGLTGTDSVCRSQENLIAKVRGLNEDGITALHWCGSYRLPAATATGSVQRELCLVASCCGVGEVAVSDHRGSAPTAHDLAQLALEARVGGMLSGKAGVVHCHMGPGQARLQPLREALASTCGDLPITAFHPTHMDRSPQLAADGAVWLADGGTLDLTCSSPDCRAVVRQYRSEGVPLGGVTVSTDAYGSLPVFDEQGRLVQYDVADPGAVLRFLRAMHLEERWPLGQVLPLMTANPARRLKLHSKGCIAVGADADILLLEPRTLELRWVLARGEVVKGTDAEGDWVVARGPPYPPRCWLAAQGHPSLATAWQPKDTPPWACLRPTRARNSPPAS